MGVPNYRPGDDGGAITLLGVSESDLTIGTDFI